MGDRRVRAWRVSLPIRGTFRISRGSKTHAESVVVEIRDGGVVGRGECVPYARYGETVDSVLAQISSIASTLEAGLGIEALQATLPPGSSRNAVDCALWDLISRQSGRSVAETAGLPGPLRPVTTVFTISLDTPEAMAAKARANAHLPWLKLKLGGEGDLDRVRAVRAAAPRCRLLADANESWTPEDLDRYLPSFASLGVEYLEQPLPAGKDEALRGYRSPVALVADESCRDLSSLAGMAGKYSVANIKLDKTGGLTEALALSREARAAGFKLMVGCMVASSLSMAPGIVIAQNADVIHLDGPLLLQRDCEPGLRYLGAVLFPDSRVWSV